MKGDFSRVTFDRRRHYARVLMQQGRVQLDADWNEQTSIILHYLRSLGADLIGPHGGPGDGFKIEPLLDQEGNAVPCDFAIQCGHYWVDGILCEIDAPQACPPVPCLPLPYSAQPDYPMDEGDKLKVNTDYFVYLDVWERFVSHLQDGRIREAALGGPDTAARAQIVCQVKAWNLSALKGPDAPDKDCQTLLAELRRPKIRCLRARARIEKPSEDPCITPPQARYRGAENQLYRVEVHRGGKAGAPKDPATFKWSRDNGSLVYAVESLDGSIATVEDLGRDDDQRLQEGQWVEYLNDFRLLRAEPGPLLKVIAVETLDRRVTLEGNGLSSDDEEGNPLLRRWDQKSTGSRELVEGAQPIVEGSWIELEDGVQVYFEKDGDYQSGDYWLIPARTATGDVEWPQETGDDGAQVPKALGPRGIEHHYAPLAIISIDVEGYLKDDPLEDCRCTFEPLCPPVQAAAPPVIESISADPPTVDDCEDTPPVQFGAKVQGAPPLSYKWDFGDGGTSPEKAPAHKYAKAARYAVQLELSNRDGSARKTMRFVVTDCLPSPAPLPQAEVPLTRIEGIGATFAARLKAAGITHAAQVAALQPEELAKLLSPETGPQVSEERALSIIEDAKKISQ